MDEAVAGSEEQQVKVLQCCMPLLTHFPLLTGVPLLRLLLVTIRLFDSDAPMVHHTAAATIRQIVVWLFERDQQKQAALSSVLVKLAPLAPGSDAPADCEMEAFEADAFIVLQDLCLLLNGENALALGIPKLATGLALEVVESVLSEHPRIVRERPRLMDLIRSRLCTLCIRRFAERAPFPEQCRLWRLVLVMLRHYHDLLPIECEMFASTLSRLLPHDSTAQMNDWELALMVESTADVLADDALVADCQRVAAEAGVGFGQASLTQWLNDLSGLLLLLPDPAANIGSPRPAASLSSLKVPLLGQFDKLQAPLLPPLYPYHLALSTIHRYLSSSGPIKPAILEAIWEKLITALLKLLGRDTWPEITRETTYALLQRLARAPLSDPLDSCIKALVDADPWGLLKLAIEEGEQLGASWLPLLRVIHALDGNDRVEEWTTSTRGLSDECYAKLQEAMTRMLAENPAFIPRVRLAVSVNLQRPLSFEELFRAMAGWLDNAEPAIRAQASQAMTSFCLGGLAYSPNGPTGEDGWLLTLLLMAQAEPEDVHRVCLECLGRILERHELHASGWASVMEIMGCLLDPAQTQLPILRSCFALLKLICTDHLASLPIDSCLRPLVDLLGRVAEQKLDLNVALTAIGLVWDVSDHLQGRRQEEAHRAWLHLLAKLSHLTRQEEERSEIRSSAVATLCRCIQSTASSLQPAQWDELLTDLWLPILKDDARRAPETLIQLLNGITSLLSLQMGRMSPRYWTEIWPELLGACLTWVKEGLVDCGVGCFASLVEAAMTSNEGSSRVNVGDRPFAIWQEMAECCKGDLRFGQAALVKLVSLLQWMPQRDRDPQSCISVLRMALNHPLWDGPLRDVQDCSELQAASLRMLMLLEKHEKLLMKELSAWIQLPLESGSTPLSQITTEKARRNASKESPRLSYAKALLSQQPSVPSLPPPPCTFVALSLRAMDLLTGLWHRHYSTGDHDPLSESLHSLGQFMRVKYEAPRQLWRRATLGWMGIVRLALSKSQTPEVERQRLIIGPWREALEVSVQLGNTCRWDIEDDEQFDIDSLLTFPLTEILPRLPAELQSEMIKVLADSSHLYRPAEEMPLSLGWTCPVKIVLKRRLAMGCLQSLVDLVGGSDAQLSQVALPFLLQRLQSIIDRYWQDRKQLGTIPFPMVREQEVRFCLETIASLRLKEHEDPIYHLRMLRESLGAAMIVVKGSSGSPAAGLSQLLQSCINPI